MYRCLIHESTKKTLMQLNISGISLRDKKERERGEERREGEITGFPSTEGPPWENKTTGPVDPTVSLGRVTRKGSNDSPHSYGGNTTESPCPKRT